jgi:hypothetical protein
MEKRRDRGLWTWMKKYLKNDPGSSEFGFQKIKIVRTFLFLWD